jgi:exodeoxyribonuclease VII large subunit
MILRDLIQDSDSTGISGPGATREHPLTIADVTRAAKDFVEAAFPAFWVNGEVSNFTKHRNGHWYFCLRDATAQINCVVWASDQLGIPAQPDEGMKVLALGRLTVFPKRGALQMVVRKMEAEGDGLWRKAMELTLAKLKADGLLAPERKRRLPVAPKTVAVVTSPQGAALHDVIAVIRRRCPGTQIVLSACKVQGDGAANDIRVALDRVLRWGLADVVIVGRGGGGREDLWAFNDERLARAVAAFPVPVIAAIGHEIDTTLCDLVADHRAPTPSAAAEAAVPDMGELRRVLIASHRQMKFSIQRKVLRSRESLKTTRGSMAKVAAAVVEMRRLRMSASTGKLNALSPLGTLSRGYAIAHAMDGTALTRREQFDVGLSFVLRLADGLVPSRVAEKPKELKG